ncbi:MAG: pyruvate ferredoxin oxidoreductase [bacterium]|nr:pyruvate ferredoxin oxidoreductase [bacterium]MDD5755959.1 pyruvate ferredoxin oxidoreductase [bacterium]
MSEKKNLKAKTGNEAMAEAMRQINPDVVAAYPITPATEIVQIFSQFVADGVVNTEFVAVESEHSALSACIGASAAGARAMTGTSSQGLALMYEMMYIAAGLRLPIVIAEVNRALSAPINIHGDQSDTMGARDSGFLQIYCENSQEAYDSMIQAVRICEHPDVLLPATVSTDGFIISHCMEAIELLPDEKVKEFVGTYKPKNWLLDVDHPFTLGAIDLQDYYFEHKRQEIEAMRKATKVIKEIGKEFGQKFGRSYDMIETYKLEDAEAAIVVLGSTAGTAKVVIEEMRKQGKKVGMLKLRVFRPFPFDDIREALKDVKIVGVMDRHDGYNGYVAPVCSEVRSCLYELDKKPKIASYVYGLGGRDITLEMITEIYEELLSGKTDNNAKYIGVRE